ncbi:MAG: hypothetical protein Kow0077_09610 [Anaerolineae bacterium]
MKNHDRVVIGSVLLLVLAIGMLLSACSGPSTPTPTPLPTATPTPRSTPLPALPTAVPPGSADLPVQMIVAPVEEPDSDRAEALAAALSEQTGLAMDVELAADSSAVMGLLCGGTPFVGWLDGVAFMAALAQDCVDPSLQIRRGGITGVQAELLINSDLVGQQPGPEDVASIAGRAFCRLNADDAVSWVIASLMLYQGGVHPLYDLQRIVEVESYDALVEAIYNRQCLAGAVPAGYLEADLDPDVADLEGLTERVLVVAESPVFPLGVMVYPDTVPLHIRLALTDTLLRMAAERDPVLVDVLGPVSLQRVAADDFADLRDFAEATGLDFAALGE